jgi:hypothetical protein
MGYGCCMNCRGSLRWCEEGTEMRNWFKTHHSLKIPSLIFCVRVSKCLTTAEDVLAAEPGECFPG